MNDLKDIGNKYGGAITGILLVVACVYFGNYIQKNKDHVKESTKNFIDKL